MPMTTRNVLIYAAPTYEDFVPLGAPVLELTGVVELPPDNIVPGVSPGSAIKRFVINGFVGTVSSRLFCN